MTKVTGNLCDACGKMLVEDTPLGPCVHLATFRQAILPYLDLPLDTILQTGRGAAVATDQDGLDFCNPTCWRSWITNEFARLTTRASAVHEARVRQIEAANAGPTT